MSLHHFHSRIDKVSREKLSALVQPGGGPFSAQEGGALILADRGAGVDITLSGPNRDALFWLRAGVMAQLETLSPEQAPLTWDGADQPGDLAPYFSFAQVRGMEIVNDDFVRLRIVGNDLARFAQGGMHFRLLRQQRPDQAPLWPRLNEKGSVDWPEDERQLIHKVYTVRHLDRIGHEFTVDIFRHDGGPTCGWAERNPVGEWIGITGPGGGEMPAGGWMLLAGDETAQPAILRMLEELPAETEGVAYVLAGAQGRECDVTNRTRIALTWLYRDQGDDLERHVTAIMPPRRADSYLWFAASKPEARRMREHFKTTLCQEATRLKSAGYWG